MAGQQDKFSLDKFRDVKDKGDMAFWGDIFRRGEDASKTYIRTNVFDEGELLNFLKNCEASFKIKFTVERCQSSARYICNKVFRCHHGTHNMRSNVKEPRKKMGQVFLFAYKIIEKYKKIPSLVYLPADYVTIIIFMVLMKRTDDRNLKMFIICGAYFNN